MKNAALFALVLGLCTGAALAQESDDHAHPAPAPKASPTYTPPPATQTRKVPKTCDEKCVAVVEPCSQSCKKQKNPAAKGACQKGCNDMEAACSDSCREKGKIDPEYIKSKVMPPEKGSK